MACSDSVAAAFGGAFMGFPNSPTGAARISLLDGSANLSNCPSHPGIVSFAHGLTWDDTNDDLYVCDYGGYNICKVAPDGECTFFLTNTQANALLCDACNHELGDGPNWVVMGPRDNDGSYSHLIVSVYPVGFVKVPLDSPGNATAINIYSEDWKGVGLGPDGIAFDPTTNVLFASIYGGNQVSVFTSTDDWENAQFNGAIELNCQPGENSTTTTIAGDALVVFCSNNFGSGPYNTSRLSDISTRFTTELAPAAMTTTLTSVTSWSLAAGKQLLPSCFSQSLLSAQSLESSTFENPANATERTPTRFRACDGDKE